MDDARKNRIILIARAMESVVTECEEGCSIERQMRFNNLAMCLWMEARAMMLEEDQDDQAA